LDFSRLIYRRHHLKILLVEDDPATMPLVSKYLEGEGYTIESAPSGEKGWKALIFSRPDLVIVDWSMPDISGLALCQRIKANVRYPELSATYVILLTAYFSIEHRVLGLEAGADEFLTKPIDPSELKARVRAGLRLAVLNQAIEAAQRKEIARDRLFGLLRLSDPITGVLNRQAMERGLPQLLQQLKQEAQNTNSIHFSIFNIYINNFPAITKQHGHKIAKEALKAIAGRLQNNCFPQGFLYYCGDMEFVCTIPYLNTSACLDLAKNLTTAITRDPIAVSYGLLVPMTICIGITTCKFENKSSAESTTPSAENLLLQAMQARIQAQQVGENGIHLYDTE
jgi:diguanylate cyclase (GGDEF)-like protein